MNVVQVTMTTIYPPDSGGAERSHGLVSSFPELGDTVDRVCQGGLATNHDLPRFERRVEIEPGYVEHRPLNPFHDLASLPPALFDLPNVYMGSMLRRWPPRALTQALASADVALVEGPLQVAAVDALAPDVPVVYSSHNVEVDRFEPLADRFFGRFAYGRLCRLEQQAVDRSAAVVCCSAADRDRYRERFDADRVVVAPNGTSRENVSDISGSTGLDLHERYDVPADRLVAVFVGSDYGPNVEAAQFLLDEADSFEAHGVHTVVVGDVCDSVTGSHDAVTKAGFVDDLHGHLRGADVGLNPVTRGGGSNIKMLDYFAASLPVVSTPFGTEGFDVDDGEHLVVRERDQFADAFEQLTDPDRRERLAQNAHELVQNRYVWEQISRDLRRELSTLVA